ncbi:MAG: UDP-glucose/GDP-mannose dehydrogenase family protein [Chlamydiales bacterium]
MKVLIIGTGYVGLVTGACFAEMGNHVICLDIDREKIEQLKMGKIPIYEPGLEEMICRNQKAGRLEFTTSYTYGVHTSLFCFIAVSTPSSPDGSVNLTHVEEAAEQIAEAMNGYKIIINKSTVPVGSACAVREMIAKILQKRGVSYQFDTLSNPEFLKEGDAIHDFMKPDRIIIGSDHPRANSLMEELYAPFNVSHDRLIIMDSRSAEMTKYAANAMLASRISFMNEIASLCEHVGADISLIRKGIGSDQRIGYAFLYAGAGYGGSCFPKDIQAIRAIGRKYHSPTPLIDAIDLVNRRQKALLGEKIMSYFNDDLFGKTIAIWGLSFKPGTDDIREAPALVLIRQLIEKGAHVRLYDPVAMPKAKAVLKTSPQIVWSKDEFEAAREADAIALVTDWKQFRFVDFDKVFPKQRLFFDGRNQYDPQEMVARGYEYYSIGYQSIGPSKVCK